jgi:hypothetical protein
MEPVRAGCPGDSRCPFRERRSRWDGSIRRLHERVVQPRLHETTHRRLGGLRGRTVLPTLGRTFRSYLEPVCPSLPLLGIRATAQAVAGARQRREPDPFELLATFLPRIPAARHLRCLEGHRVGVVDGLAENLQAGVPDVAVGVCHEREESERCVAPMTSKRSRRRKHSALNWKSLSFVL